MIPISELHDVPKYNIKSVCTQTGIRPVTLRAWERRHEVLTPHRAENRYRLYSDRDVALLRWIKNRVDEGVSISSAVSELRSMLRNGVWPETSSVSVDAPVRKSDAPPSDYAHGLYQALIQHDEARAGELLREANAAFDIRTLCQDVITPCLVKIGEAWYSGQIRITTEHFASAYLRGKLLSIMQTYPTRRSAQHVLVGGAPMEQHEIGSLMMALLLRSEGYRVEFLGPDLPLEDLVDYASYEKPHMIILSATLTESAEALRTFNAKLSRLRPAPIFGYGGAIFRMKPELRKQVPGVYLGDTLEEGLEKCASLLEEKTAQRRK